MIEEVAHGTCCGELADRVETSIRTELVIHQAVVVADASANGIIFPQADN